MQIHYCVFFFFSIIDLYEIKCITVKQRDSNVRNFGNFVGTNCTLLIRQQIVSNVNIFLRLWFSFLFFLNKTDARSSEYKITYGPVPPVERNVNLMHIFMSSFLPFLRNYIIVHIQTQNVLEMENNFISIRIWSFHKSSSHIKMPFEWI